MRAGFMFVIVLSVAGVLAFHESYKTIQKLPAYKNYNCTHQCGNVQFFSGEHTHDIYNGSAPGFSTATFMVNYQNKKFCGRAFLTCAPKVGQNHVVIGYYDTNVTWHALTHDKAYTTTLTLNCNDDGEWEMKDVDNNQIYTANNATLHCVGYKSDTKN
uniref:C6 domain-containing protein n=1 Tax=Acrobeloides nanus TaxID=290746 RepID=A0A914E3T6_9BILA